MKENDGKEKMPKFKLWDRPVWSMVEGFVFLQDFKNKYSKENQRIQEAFDTVGRIPWEGFDPIFTEWEESVLGYYITRGILSACKVYWTGSRLADLDLDTVLNPSAIPDEKSKQAMEDFANQTCLEQPEEAKRYRENLQLLKQSTYQNAWYAFMYGYLWMTKMIPFVEPYQDEENINWIHEQLT